MKSFVSIVFLNIALARPDHGVVHPGAHHSVHHAAHQVVHHQPAVHHAVHHQPAVHHAVHHQPAAVHHAVHSVHQPMVHHAVHHHQPVVPVEVKEAPKTIAELVVSEPRFSTLLAAVKAADLVDTLSGEGPFTVFAPTNDAFAKVPKDALNSLLADKDALTAVLLRHVVPGAALTAQDVPVGSTDVKTAGGEEITVTRGDYIKVKSSAGEAGVVAFDVLATNGVVHLVDTVF